MHDYKSFCVPFCASLFIDLKLHYLLCGYLGAVEQVKNKTSDILLALIFIMANVIKPSKQTDTDIIIHWNHV